MTVLICGASGIVGRDLLRTLKHHNVNVIGTCHTRKTGDLITVDFEDYRQVQKLFQQQQPQICINCIAQRFVDVCDKDWEHAKNINVDIVDTITNFCNQFNTYLIHISSDYVFDGTNPPYSPTSTTNPLQNYGLSKLYAEEIVLSNIKNSVIIRVPVLYTNNVNNFEETAVTLIGKKILNQIEAVTEDDLSIRRPVYIPDLCNFIVNLIKHHKYGICHFYNPYDTTTKYRIAANIANYLNKPMQHVTPLKTTNNKRPYDTQLTDNTYDITQYSITRLSDGFIKCFQDLYHPKLSCCNKNVFILLDLDGTLIDSEYIHYQCYQKTLEEYNVTITFAEFENAINFAGVDNLLINKNLSIQDIQSIKLKKNAILSQTSTVNFMKGAHELINVIVENDINHVVVTNTSIKNILHFKQLLPSLSKLKKWVTREDYTLPKPSNECYVYAKNKYYNNEPYIIGVENTINGYEALREITKCIYFVTSCNRSNYKDMKNKDVYLIDDLRLIL